MLITALINVPFIWIVNIYLIIHVETTDISSDQRASSSVRPDTCPPNREQTSAVNHDVSPHVFYSVKKLKDICIASAIENTTHPLVWCHEHRCVCVVWRRPPAWQRASAWIIDEEMGPSGEGRRRRSQRRQPTSSVGRKYTTGIIGKTHAISVSDVRNSCKIQRSGSLRSSYMCVRRS